MGNNGISLIIITYNRKNELAYTIELLKNMTCHHNYEIIIIDQNSNDGTEGLFNKEQSYIRYIKLKENMGVAAGRNKGVEYAKYEYMIFMDDDAHFVSNDALDIIFDWMEKNVDINLFAFQIRNLDGGNYNWPYPKRKLKSVNDMFYCNKYIGCGHAIRKSFFTSVHGYSDSLFFWGEETEMVLKSFATTGKSVIYNGTIKMIHRVKGNGRCADAGRFYYQVRNRLFIIKNMIPRSAFLYYIYYKYGYLLKAINKGWISEYMNAVENLKNMNTSRDITLNLKQFIRYLFYSL